MVATDSLAGLRAGTEADAIDGVTPRQVLAPRTPEELAGALAVASQQRWHTVIRGGGTKLGWGRPASSIDLALGTAALNQLIAHRYGDMTATVQAGASLAEVNGALAQHGQWLPLDSAFGGATIGGLVATNDAGPSRHRNGTPRDLVIGMTVAMTDGRLIKSGGTVVKNVAGYDLGKLMSGSFGSLAAIIDVTFKLLPIPASSATLVVPYDEGTQLAADVAALTASQVEPFALDLSVAIGADGVSGRLLILFASSPQATEAQVAGARALVKRPVTVVTGGEEAALWEQQIQGPWASSANPPAVVRLSWLPAGLPQVFTAVRAAARTIGSPIAMVGRAGIGAGLITLGGDVAAQAAAIETLRASRELGHVVVLRATRSLKERVDVWGPPLSSAPMSQAIKQMFDPAGILGAGRGPV